MPSYPEDLIKSILRSTKTIAMVGASGNEMRPSYFAMKYLLDKGFLIHPINPGMAGKQILGRSVYGSLKDVRTCRHGGHLSRCERRAWHRRRSAGRERSPRHQGHLDAIGHHQRRSRRESARSRSHRHHGSLPEDRIWPPVRRDRMDGREPARHRQPQAAAVQQGRLIEARHVMLKIWGRANSINVQKAMWAVGESGVAHQRINAGGPFGGLQTPEFRAMNPNTRIPVIDDDGVVVWESHSIVRYVSAKYGKGTLWAED